MEQGNQIVDLTFEFAVLVMRVSQMLEEKKRFAHANQLFKSGTSIGANVREAQGAQSRADFLHKIENSLQRSRRNRILAIAGERV
jgi:four helix bundle protein